MNIIKEITNIKEEIKNVLTNFPILRDSDNKLIAMIWQKQIGYSQMSAQAFLANLCQEKLTSPETIRRTRQLLQAENVHLQGEKYKARQEMGKEVTKVIKDI